MRVFIGGAHNGKRAFVKKVIAEEKFSRKWFDGVLPEPGSEPIVIVGIENWLAETKLSEENAIAHIKACALGRDVIFILTEIGRGIVPIEPSARQLRDTCGRLYQQLFIEAEEVTRIWYGIAQIIKKRGE